MKKLLIIAIASGLTAGSALAQNGNPCPGAKAYQVNIIGVPKGKKPDMTGTSGHRIFVPLSGPTNIFMTGDTSTADGLQCGPNFQVTDANGTDGSATLVVPCTNIGPGSTDPGVCFDVFATALGTPGGNANVDVVCEFDATTLLDPTTAGICAQGTIDFSLTRGKGKPVQQDITKFMRATGCFDVGGVIGVCDAGDTAFNNVWIFNLESLLNYYWIYDNQGLRVAQVRFCESDNCGSVGVI